MRITDIKITNYRAFYGEHHIQLDKDGKNLMLYGENGSGKSSLFTAMKDFFLASVKKLVEVEENIFLPASKKNSAKIEVTIKESPESSKSIVFEVNALQKEIVSADKILISDANKIKGFFDYKSLLQTHIEHLDKSNVNLFNILIRNVLANAENQFTKKMLGEEWNELEDELKLRKGAWRVQWLHDNTASFSKGFKLLLQEIEKDANTFIKAFDKNINVSIIFDKCGYDEDDKSVYGNEAILEISFNNKKINKHHHFLNEARLSALAISFYLASIKVNPTKGALKILVLDDLLIGLDMSNRLPLLEILKNFFIDVKKEDQFQIIMTTYDKVWYELVKSYFGVELWKFVEVYSKRLNDEDFEIPIIKHDTGYLDKAKKYLGDKDFKASAVYIRTEFERLLKTICDKQRIPVSYKKNQKEVTSDDFWTAIESHTNLDPELVKEIKINRGVVMNPFSHYDLEKPEFEKELKDTIASVEKLKAEIGNIKKVKSIDKLEKEVARLNDELASKHKIIEDLMNKRNS